VSVKYNPNPNPPLGQPEARKWTSEQTRLIKSRLTGVSLLQGSLLFAYVTGLFLSNEYTLGLAIDLLVLVLREASRDRSIEG